MADIKSFIIDSLKRVYEKSPFVYGESNKMIHTNNSSTNATGDYSLAEGFNTLAQNTAEHAQGQYNISHTNSTIHSIGIGIDSSNRKNAFEVLNDGSVYVYGIGGYDGTNLGGSTDLQNVINNGQQSIEIDNTVTAPILQRNTLYVFSDRTADIRPSLGPTVAGYVNEYHMIIKADSNTNPTIDWQDIPNLSWYGGSGPSITAGSVTEISIIDNIAVFMQI